MSQFASEKDKAKALVPGARYSHVKDHYEVVIKEAISPQYTGDRPRVYFRRTAETANGNFKKLRRKLIRDFLAEFEPSSVLPDKTENSDLLADYAAFRQMVAAELAKLLFPAQGLKGLDGATQTHLLMQNKAVHTAATRLGLDLTAPTSPTS